MKNTKSKLVGIALSALFTAVICILAQISFLTPTGVPVTLQIFGVALCGFMLGAKKATTSVAAYILLGVIGIPVFSGFKGGIHTLFGLTGGFIFGFLAIGFFCGIVKVTKKIYLKTLFAGAGIIICHLCGVFQLMLVSRSGFSEALITASLPFILKDILLVFAAYIISKMISRKIKI